VTSIVYLRYEEGRWSSSPVLMPFAAQFAYVESFSIGSDNALHALIAVWNNSTGYESSPFEYRLVYATMDAGGWSFYNLRHDSSPAGRSSLVLDRTNTPHVSYFDTDQSGVVLKYAVKDAYGWNQSVIEEVGNHWATTSSIALGPDGAPRICFSTIQNTKGISDNKVSVLFASEISGTWEEQRVIKPCETREEGADVSLALDSHGIAHVCYGGQDRIMYASNTPNPNEVRDQLIGAALLTFPLALALSGALLVIRFKRIM